MRFGKLLAAVAQKSKANEPYVSYKVPKPRFQACAGHLCDGQLMENVDKPMEIMGKTWKNHGFFHVSSWFPPV